MAGLFKVISLTGSGEGDGTVEIEAVDVLAVDIEARVAGVDALAVGIEARVAGVDALAVGVEARVAGVDVAKVDVAKVGTVDPIEVCEFLRLILSASSKISEDTVPSADLIAVASVIEFNGSTSPPQPVAVSAIPNAAESRLMRSDPSGWFIHFSPVDELPEARFVALKTVCPLITNEYSEAVSSAVGAIRPAVENNG